MGLPIEEPDDNLESIMWRIWQDIENEMQCSKPFNPLEVVLNDDEIAQKLMPVQQIQLPANLPPPIAEQAYRSILQQIEVITIRRINAELFNATLESIRCKSQFRSKCKISATRMPDMNISLNVLPVSQGWIFEDNSSVAADKTD